MIRLLLVDDHEIVRRGLRELLETNSDLSVVQQAGSLEAALALHYWVHDKFAARIASHSFIRPL